MRTVEDQEHVEGQTEKKEASEGSPQYGDGARPRAVAKESSNTSPAGQLWVLMAVVMAGVALVSVTVVWFVLSQALVQVEGKIANQEATISARMAALSTKVEVQQNAIHTAQTTLTTLERLVVEQRQTGGVEREELTKLSEALTQLRERIAKGEQDLVRLRGAVSTLEAATETLGKTKEQRWLEEIREVLSFAERQLYFGETDHAADALERLLSRLNRSGEPMLWQPIAEALTADLARIKTMPRGTSGAIALQLQILSSALAQGTLRFAAQVSPQQAIDTPIEGEAPWYLRVWSTVVAFGRAVGQEWANWLRLERLDATKADIPLAPREVELVRLIGEGLVTTARLAAVSGEREVYRTVLEQIRAFMERYYDLHTPEAALAQGALRALSEIEIAPVRSFRLASLMALTEAERRLSAADR
ncbi:MAG: uroporphyrinogen-III C-methyltransferase [Hydrogenophilus sp.]|nr:uroporphyrinogen-III C-methyltransferase [Hydrogenophilus sp.]